MHKHLELISTKGMTKKTWLSHRRIGGSDVSTIFGLNPYKPALKLFHEMIGSITQWDEDNIATYSGRVMEDVIERNWWRYWNPEVATEEEMLLNAAANKPVRKANKFNYIIINPDVPWLSGSLDRVILPSKFNDTRGVLEIKHLLKFANQKWEGGVNPGYVLQIQAYLMLTGLKFGEVVALEDGRFPQVFPFAEDEALFDVIQEKTRDFWEKVLVGRDIWNSDLEYENKLQELSGVEPEPDGSLACEQFLKERYRQETQSNIALGDEESFQCAIEYLRSRNKIKELDEIKKRNGNILRNLLINTQAYAIDFEGRGQVTWKKTLGGRQALNVQSKLLNYDDSE